MTETPGPNLFTTDEIETLHALFMIEKPPEDGHRVQILRPEHNKVGVGLSRARDAFGKNLENSLRPGLKTNDRDLEPR